VTERDIKARLRDEVLLYPGKHAVVTQELLQSALARIEALEAERDRLLEALQEIVDRDLRCDECSASVSIYYLAKNALAPPGAPAEEGETR
jgi:hypothetical protein